MIRLNSAVLARSKVTIVAACRAAISVVLGCLKVPVPGEDLGVVGVESPVALLGVNTKDCVFSTTWLFVSDIVSRSDDQVCWRSCT